MIVALITLNHNKSPQIFTTIISFSLLEKLNNSGREHKKTAKVFLNLGKIGEDAILLLNKLYLQKDAQYNLYYKP